MYRNLLLYIFLYIASRFVMQFSVSFDADNPWVSELLKFMFDLALLSATAWTFR